MAGWGRRLPERHGLSIAPVGSFGTNFAEVAEVDMTAAIPLISRVWVATYPGSAVSPMALPRKWQAG